MTRARMPRPHEVAAARRDPRLLRAVRERQIDTAWRTRGACRTVDPETFFPAPSEDAERRAMLVAWRDDDEAQAPPTPIRRLETMNRHEGVETIMSLDHLSVVDLTADLALTEVALTEVARVDAIAAAEHIAIGHLTPVETVGAAAS